jgi:hypothetical protein
VINIDPIRLNPLFNSISPIFEGDVDFRQYGAKSATEITAEEMMVIKQCLNLCAGVHEQRRAARGAA